MALTPEQKLAVDCDGHLMLFACPGSGKTRVIISRLARIADELRDTPRLAACITYTNAAVHEIEARLRHQVQAGDENSFEIATIHGFCLNHIFRPFCHRIRGYEAGFSVVSQESDEFAEFVTAACAEHGRNNLNFRDFNEFAQLQISEAGEPIGIVQTGSIRIEEAKTFWRKLQAGGRVDFCLILYHSLQLLRRYPEVADYIASKFAYVLIDEFQDTTDLQVEILKLIAARRKTTFFMVGDPNQSIYGFAGARPDLANAFAAHIGARTDLSLSGNFRSSPGIVAHAEALIPTTPPMQAVGAARRFTEVPEYQHGARTFDVITDEFLPRLAQLGIPIGNAAILAPAWDLLFPLGRRLRDYGVSIVGPGSRPYRRNGLFTPLAEQICGYLMGTTADSIHAIERSIFFLILNATGRPRYDLFSYEGRHLVFRLVTEARRLQNAHAGALDWLRAAAASFTAMFVDAGYLPPAASGLLIESVEEMNTQMVASRVVDVANLSVEDLGVYANSSAALKLATIHNEKGREHDAVAIIGLHEGTLPHFRARSAPAIAEARRQFYVGITRAKRYLLYVTDRADSRNVPSQFLRSSGVDVC